MKPAQIAALLVAILGAYGIAAAIDRDTESRDRHAATMRENCLPGPNETSIIVSDGHTARCRIYTARSLTKGMAPALVSAAAIEVTP